MSSDVTATLKKIIVENKNTTEDEATEILSTMSKSGRLLYDVWT